MIRPDMLAAMRELVADFEPGRLDDPAFLAALFVDGWQYEYTDADVIACAVSVTQDLLQPEVETAQAKRDADRRRGQRVDGDFYLSVQARYRDLLGQFGDKAAVSLLADRYDRSERQVRRWLAKKESTDTSDS